MRNPPDGSDRRLVIPPDRSAAALRLIVALLMAAGGLTVAGAGNLHGRPAAVAGGAFLALFFALAAAFAFRVLRRNRPFLVVDREGLGLDDPRGRPVRVAWDRLDAVRCPGRSLRAGVVLVLRPGGEDGLRELRLPAKRLGGAPPQWVAGMIETFRTRPELRDRLGDSPGS
jgi:hypothetical protein